MSAWAETVVHAAGNAYPPAAGEKCANDHGHVFAEGDRAFRLTDREDDAWVCASCAGEA